MDCNSTDNQYLVKIADLEAKNDILRTTISELAAYIEKLEVRLEIDCYFKFKEEIDDPVDCWEKVIVPKNERKDQIDGIECRDCTIEMQDEFIGSLRRAFVNYIKQQNKNATEEEIAEIIASMTNENR